MAEYVGAAVLEYLYVAGVEWGTAVAASYVAEAAVFAAAIGYSQNQASIARRRAREAFNSSQVDRLVNANSTESPRELVLGRVRKGGQIFFRGSTGADNTKFVICIALAGHEIDAIEQFYLNEVPVTLDGSSNVIESPYARTANETGIASFSIGATGITLPHTPTSYTITLYGSEGPGGTLASTISGSTITFTEGSTAWQGEVVYQYTAVYSHVKLRSYLGAPGQTADATLLSLFPTLWTSDHTASGIPYVIGEFDFSEDAFPSGLPTITARLRGAKVYNPASATTVWTENPALMQRHVLLHPQFGKRSAITADEDVRILQAATECAAIVTWTVDSGSFTAPLYRAALVAPYGTAARDILDDLATAMAGRWSHAQGQFFTRAGVFHASVKTITEADLAGISRSAEGQESPSSISISAHKERASKFNVAQIRIWDQAQDFKEVPLTPLKPAALIARDGAEIAQEFRMAAVPYAWQALHIAGVTMRDARDPLTVTMVCKLTVYHIELFDTVALTLARFGWSSKLFEVVGRKWFGQGTVQLVLKEVSATNYDLDANFVPGGHADNTSLTTPSLINPPTTLTAVSGTAELERLGDGTVLTRVRVSWDTITNRAILESGWIDISYRAGGMGSWVQQTVSGDSVDALLRGVQDSAVIVIRARCRSTIATSIWSQQISHTVVGKTALPTTPTSFTGTVSKGIIRWTWAQIADTDYSNSEVRPSDINWGLASPAPIFKGTANSCVEQASAEGVLTRYISHYDSSGNKSAAASASVTVTTEDLTGVGHYALPITIYKQAATIPDAPSGGSYTFTGDTFIAPSGYSRELLNGSTTPIWASMWLFETTTPTIPIPGPLAGDPHYTAIVGDPYWENVALLLHAEAVADSSSRTKTISASGSASISGAQQMFGSSSFVYDGTTDYISAANSAEFDFGTGDFTVEFWARPTTVTSNYFLARRDGTNQGWYVYVSGSDVGWGRSGPVNSADQIGGTVAAGTWKHHAFVRISGVTKGYCNGILDSSITDTTNYTGVTTALTVGADYNGTASLNGHIDELRITKGIGRYTANFVPQTAAHPDGPVVYATTTVEDFSNGIAGYTVEVGSAGTFTVADDTYGPTLTVLGGIGTLQRLAGPFVRPDLDSWSFVFQIGTADIDDTASIELDDASGAALWTFTAAREHAYDTSERAHFWWRNTSATGATDKIISTARLSSFVWYHFSARFIGSALYTFITNLETGEVTSTLVHATNARPIQVEIIKFWQDADIDTVTCKFADIVTGVTEPKTVLLLHGETLTDSSPDPKLVAAVGNAAVSTAQQMFGSSSFVFDGTGDYLAVANNPDFDFGPGDYTVEFWLKLDLANITNSPFLISREDGTRQGWYLRVPSSGSGVVGFGRTGPGTSYSNGSIVCATGGWKHIAACRENGVFYLFVEGVLALTFADVSSYAGVTTDLRIGASQSGAGSLNGYIDEIRITRGAARYVADFTPPTSPFYDYGGSGWPTPIKMVQDGAPGTGGTSIYTGVIYQQAASVTPPTDGTGSFDFATGILTPPSGWVVSQPSTTTTPTWVSEFNFVTSVPDAVVTAGTWTTPVIDAVAGGGGLSILTLELYSVGLSTAPVSGTATYTFTGDVFTPGTLTAGWSRSMPASSITPTYRSAFTFVSTDPATPVAAGTWSTPVIVAQNGADGAGGSALTLTATSQTFTYDATGTASPSSQTITCTANLTGGLSGTATFVCELYNAAGTQSGITVPTPTMGGTGNVRTLTDTQFANAAFAVINADLSGYGDQTTLVKLRDGSHGITVILTNESTTVPAASDGSGADFSASGGTMRIWDGSVEKTGNTSVTTYSVVGAPTGGLSISIADTGIYTVSALTSDHGTAILRVAYGSVNYDKFFDITKSLGGVSAVSFDLSANGVTLAADTTGYVASYAAATTTARVMIGNVDDTSNWTISVTNGAGVTSSLSGAQVSVTAMTVDSGYVTIAATRSGYPNQSKRFTVTKARSSSTTSGPVTGLNFFSTSASYTTSASTGVRFKSDGTVWTQYGGGYELSGNWFAPTTTGVGTTPGYWIQVTQIGGYTPSGAALATVLALSSDREWSYSVTGESQLRQGSFSYIIYSDSGGATPVATGFFDMDCQTAPFA